MADITFSQSYKHYNLYSGSKNSNGFYSAILHKIDLIFNDALENFTIPVVGHIIIDNPKVYRINQALSRIISNEANIRGMAIPKFHYISVIERRKNDKNLHQHLAIFLDNGNYEFFKVIQLSLRKFSYTSKARLIKRRHKNRPESIDKLTGEIRKIGPMYHHNLRRETFDAFERISYIAKVETKISPKFSSSRLNTVI